MATTPQPEHHRQAESLFQAAADLPEAERAAFLEEACAEDAALRRRVETLLAHLSAAEGRFLARPALGAARAESDAGSSPRRVDRYRIARQIGEGGMGTVYEAEQESPRRTVALKLIRGGFVTAQTLRRFRFEKEILGQLQHPGIAQIFEAGMAPVESDAGTSPPQPFFAMEFVRGESLTRHAQSRRLGTRARLELFARVCDAVEHAHQKGVIHRDLKPANILVDPSGQPKVLDFGIARLVGAEASAVSFATAPGQLIGTLAYMSPEQVSVEPGGVDTRSDVYSLGVILFEMLTGTLPIDVAGCSLAEAIRRIGDEEPRRAGACDPALRGEIESICAAALHKVKARRYQSASRLGDDVRRFLAGDPVDVRRDSTFYLLRKSLQRHRVPALAGVLLLFSLSAFAVYAAVQARRFREVAHSEREARREADAQRQSAEGQSARATAVAGLLRDMLTSADPNEVKGRDYTVRQLLDDFSLRLSPEMIGRPEVGAMVRTALGTAYRGLAEFERADEHLEAALRSAREAFGESHAEVARVLEEQAWLRHLEARYDEGMDLCLRALSMRRQLLGPDHADLAASLDQWAQFLITSGRYQEAESPCVESLAMRRRLLGDGHLLVAQSLHGLGLVRQHEGEFAAAEPLYRESLSIRRRALGASHPTVAQTTFDLASVLKDRGRHADAEEMFRAALAAKIAAFGDEHPEVAWSLTGLATVLRVRAKYEEAEQANRRALAIWENAQGRAHPAAGVTMQNLAVVLRDLGRLDEAESLLRERLAVSAASSPRAIAQTLINLGAVLRDAGRLDDSRETYERARAMLDEVGPGEHPHKTAAAVGLAETLLLQSLPDAAATMLEEAVGQCCRLHGESHRTTLSAVALHARALCASGRHATAVAMMNAALALAERALEPSDSVLAEVRLAFAEALLGGEAPADARRAVVLADEALALRSAVLSPSHWRIGEAMAMLGRCLGAAGRTVEAESVLLDAAANLKAALGSEHALTQSVKGWR